jgi:hypothetical protein
VRPHTLTLHAPNCQTLTLSPSLVCRASKILGLEEALLDAEARAKDAVAKAGQAADDRDHAVALKNSVLREREEAARHPIPPPWTSLPPVDADVPLNFAPPHVMAALYPNASQQSFFKPPGFTGALGQHPMPMWPHVPPGAPALGMLPPPPSGMGLHVGHDTQFPPVFGDFQQDPSALAANGAPPGYFGALQPNTMPVAAAPLAASAPTPATLARETAPPMLDERQLVDVFLRAGTLVARLLCAHAPTAAC